MKRLGMLVLVALTAIMLLSPVVSAEPAPKSKGLFVTPLREYVTIKAGEVKNDTLTVANLTSSPLTVTLSSERFSVADGTYDYRFRTDPENWITFETSRLELPPGISKKIPYTIAAPKSASPGGHYFTLFATSMMGEGTIKSKVQVATVLYMTIAGKLQHSSSLENDKVPTVLFGGDIPFEFDVKSSGNVHFFAYVFGKWEGLGSAKEQEVAHIILPNTTRAIHYTLPPPVLPGVYKLAYGYKTEQGSTVIRERYLVHLPLWSIALLIGVVWLTVLLIRHYRKRPKDSSPPPHK